MNIEVKVISQFVYNPLFEVEDGNLLDIRAWLASNNYKVISPLSKDAFHIEAYKVSEFDSALARDCKRFCMASFETNNGVAKEPVFPKSGSWIIIRKYYSAFYAIHAILRMFGRIATHLEHEYTKKILNNAITYSLDNGVTKLDSGLYIGSYQRSTQQLLAKSHNDPHKDAWGAFLELCDWLTKVIPTATALDKEKGSAIDWLSNVKTCITKEGLTKGQWPSMLRNKVNYQHSHGAWFPYREGAIPNHLISSSVKSKCKEKSEIIDIKEGDLEIFFKLTSQLVAFCRALLEHCIKVHSSKKSVIAVNILQMLRLIDAP